MSIGDQLYCQLIAIIYILTQVRQIFWQTHSWWAFIKIYRHYLFWVVGEISFILNNSSP